MLPNLPEELTLAQEQEQEQLLAPGTTGPSQALAQHPALASGPGKSQQCMESFLCSSSSFRLGELQRWQRWSKGMGSILTLTALLLGQERENTHIPKG